MGLELVLQEAKREEKKNEELKSKLMKGVRHLCEGGITRVPSKYILPVSDRPEPKEPRTVNSKLKLPVIDLARLHTSDRSQVLQTLAQACEEYGFFQVLSLPTSICSVFLGFLPCSLT